MTALSGGAGKGFRRSERVRPGGGRIEGREGEGVRGWLKKSEDELIAWQINR